MEFIYCFVPPSSSINFITSDRFRKVATAPKKRSLLKRGVTLEIVLSHLNTWIESERSFDAQSSL